MFTAPAGTVTVVVLSAEVSEAACEGLTLCRTTSGVGVGVIVGVAVAVGIGVGVSDTPNTPKNVKWLACPHATPAVRVLCNATQAGGISCSL